MGDPGDDSTVVSSLIDSRAAQRVRDWIEQAVEGGASIVTASVVAESPDSSRLDWDSDRLKAHNIVAPTLLRDVESDMLVSCDEVFGPVIGFSSYSRLEDAIEASNGTRYGLQAGIFTIPNRHRTSGGIPTPIRRRDRQRHLVVSHGSTALRWGQGLGQHS
ncbi:MAG: aldehyde dehydrogenase family protein [Microthrixaceae bacterium]